MDDQAERPSPVDIPLVVESIRSIIDGLERDYPDAEIVTPAKFADGTPRQFERHPDLAAAYRRWKTLQPETIPPTIQ